MGRFGPTEILLLSIIGIVIYKILIKKRVSSKTEINKSLDNIIDIPEACPHCKNQNTKKIRLCEWCGNQII
jgi:aspartyl aminopeptidase